MEWINVKDKLPSEEGRYIVNLNGYVLEATFYSDLKIWGDNEVTTYSDVTHWMPLPNPPANE